MSLDLKTLVIIREAASALIDHAAGLARVAFEADPGRPGRRSSSRSLAVEAAS